MAGIGGGAALVGHDAEAVAFAAEAEHGFHEVVAVFAEHPGGAQDDVARAGGLHGLFAGQFALAVYRSGIGSVGFEVGAFGAAVENVVGGNMQDGGACGVGGAGKVFGAFGVGGIGGGRFAFGFIHGGVGGGVDDHVGLLALNGLQYGGTVGDVEFTAVVSGYLKIVGGGLLDEGLANLAMVAGDEEFHGGYLKFGCLIKQYGLVQQFAGEVFGRELGLALQRPFDADCGVIPQQGVLGFGVVVVGAFVNEFGLFTQYIEAVGEAFGHPELVFVFGGEDGAGPLAEGGGAAAQVDGHVEHFAGNHAHEFALGVFGLVVQAAQDGLAGFGVVFLHEGTRGDVFAKPVVAEGFHKEATFVAVDLGLEEFDVGDGGGEDVHNGASGWGWKKGFR